MRKLFADFGASLIFDIDLALTPAAPPGDFSGERPK